MTNDLIIGIVGIVTGLSGMVTGIAGMLMGLRSIWISRYDITKEYFKNDDSEEMRKARKYIYNNKAKSKEQLIKDENYAIICSHYHFYGLMRKKHYIPGYVFKGVNKEAIIKCYELSYEYIQLRRETYIGYAKYFEWLYNKLKSK